MFIRDELNLCKMSKNADFSETCFSQVNDVGLSMYAVYVINKMVLIYFIESWIILLWKWIIFWKSGNMIWTLCFVRFHGNWPVKRSCTYTYIHMWLVYLHSWGNWVVLLCLVHWPQLLKLWIILYELGWKYSLNSFALKFFHEWFDMNI